MGLCFGLDPFRKQMTVMGHKNSCLLGRRNMFRLRKQWRLLSWDRAVFGHSCVLDNVRGLCVLNINTLLPCLCHDPS